ncbi:hypothetical protein FRC00_009479, partial [Tulasnella sp. 408]
MRLPSEILADTIGPLLTQEDYPKALLRLSHSSHRIREILLSSPWVWAGARIKSSWHPNLVTAMLEQTGETLLRVSCDFAASRSVLGSEKIASCIQRWQSAHLKVPSFPEFPAALAQLCSLAAPALEELVVSVPHRPLPTIVPELFSGAAPQLRSIEFHNFSINPDSPLWLNLHSLHLNIQQLWAVLSPHQLFSILVASPGLQILRLCDRMVGLAQTQEPDPYPVIELPHLSTMELAVVPCMLPTLLNTIKGPAVTQLEITTTFIDESPQLPRKVLGSLFKSAAPILATLAGDDEPPTARITVESSVLHFFVIAAFLANQEHLARRDLSTADATLVDVTIGGPRTPLTEQQVPATIAISPSVIEQRPSTQHGLILPPFPRRVNEEGKVMPTRLTVSEANEEMERLFGMLDEFDEHPPFTIQRICELLTRPSIYKSLGKFLRAFERTLLVTSTADQYTSDTYAATAAQSVISPTLSDTALKLAMTPLFSPIPFLHPELDPVTGQPIPGVRNGTSATTPSPMLLNGDTEVDVPSSPRLGLVDELDDPAADSNHLADHPRAISATTNLAVSNPARVVVDMDDMEMDEGTDLFGSSMFSSAGGGSTGGTGNGAGGPL